jgi:hypothetical protein
VFLFGSRRFTRLGPLGLAFGAFQLWRRLSPAQKAAIQSRAQGLLGGLGGGGARGGATRLDDAAAGWPVSAPAASRAGAATAPAEEVAPSDLTSPGTIADPDLEQRRAEQAVERERESRATDQTKFEELRREQESERHERAAAIGEPPPPTDDA